MNEIDISGLDKAEVLLALYNTSRPQGRGYLQDAMAIPFDLEAARAVVAAHTKFDYVLGRVIKVDLSGDSFDPWLYDRDNGEGVAARAVARLRGQA